jgi:hypothetical protein
MIKFIKFEEDTFTRIEFQISDESNLSEVLETIVLFLRASGYMIEYNKTLDLVDIDA